MITRSGAGVYVHRTWIFITNTDLDTIVSIRPKENNKANPFWGNPPIGLLDTCKPDQAIARMGLVSWRLEIWSTDIDE